LERRNVKSLDSKLRTDAGMARAVITNIFKGLSPVSMRQCLLFLGDSIDFLSSHHPDRWGITLFKDGVRLNAGWAQVLLLRTDELYVLVERITAPSGAIFLKEKLGTAPGCSFTKVPFSKLHITLPTLSAGQRVPVPKKTSTKLPMTSFAKLSDDMNG
jgi:hypothetical protein